MQRYREMLDAAEDFEEELHNLPQFREAVSRYILTVKMTHKIIEGDQQ